MSGKRVKVVSPDGKSGSIPEEQLTAALAQGYTRADGAAGGSEEKGEPAGLPDEQAEAAPAPPAADTSDSMLGSAMRAVPGVLSDLGIGALKGVGDAVVGAGEMVHKIPGVSALVDRAYGQPGLSRTAFAEGHRELKPTSTAQSLGKGAADLGMMAIAPEGGIPARMAASALVSGAQTGGDPKSMALSSGFTGAGGVAEKGMAKVADAVRKGQAEVVSASRTADLAKRGLKGDARKNAMNDPMWMQAQETNTSRFTNLIKQYGLTGNPSKDATIIGQAPARDQEVLSALSRQMNPAKHQMGHEWSMAELAGNLVPSAALGMANPALGVGSVPAILLMRSLMKKYPGYAAQAFDAGAAGASAVGRGVGEAVGLGAHDDDPLVQELMRRQGGGQ